MSTVISSFNKTAYKKTDNNPNVVQILKTCLEYMGLNIYKFLISRNIFADLKGPKEKDRSFLAYKSNKIAKHNFP